jgi:hypothetical protein
VSPAPGDGRDLGPAATPEMVATPLLRRYAEAMRRWRVSRTAGVARGDKASRPCSAMTHAHDLPLGLDAPAKNRTTGSRDLES